MKLLECLKQRTSSSILDIQEPDTQNLTIPWSLLRPFHPCSNDPVPFVGYFPWHNVMVNLPVKFRRSGDTWKTIFQSPPYKGLFAYGNSQKGLYQCGKTHLNCGWNHTQGRVHCIKWRELAKHKLAIVSLHSCGCRETSCSKLRIFWPFHHVGL